jgi:hypothetical protein
MTRIIPDDDRPTPPDDKPVIDTPPIDDTPVPPLTEPDDTEGG